MSPTRSVQLAVQLAVLLAVVLAASAFAAVLPGAATPTGDATLTISVVMRDYSFKLSRRSVPAGSRVRFVVHNRGAVPHDFAIAGKRTRFLKRGQTQTLTVLFRRKGSYKFVCSVPGHAHLGMRGTFSVGGPPAAAPPPPPPVVVSGTAVLTKVGSFDQPVLVTAPAGDTDTAYVVEQTGAVRILRNGSILPRPFLDLRDKVLASGESGLLSIAFAPDYATSGRLYAFYNRRSGYGDIRIAELRRDGSDSDRVDPASERALVSITKPYENHNGGMLQFGPDGYLYASVGDGDPGVINPAGFFAQRLDSLLGSILRIDPASGDPYGVPASNPFVAVAGARPEIWAYGLRNPWRFWIDAETGAMVIADVGSTSREEVDVVARGESGVNFGWPCFEGSLVFDATATCERPVGPVHEFARAGDVCAIIGGVVARDRRIAALDGRYLYGDLCTGRITALALTGGTVTDADELDFFVPAPTSFGVDGASRIYVTTAGGDVFRLDPKPAG
jgi:glucose/arabinose dehydrogenase